MTKDEALELLRGGPEKIEVFNELRKRDGNRLDLKLTWLEGYNLSGANLENSDLFGANLKGANLSGARLRRVNLHFAILRGAHLKGADLEAANLDRTDFRAADLSDAQLREIPSLSGDFSNASLTGCKLTGSEIGRGSRKLRLDGNDLSGVRFAPNAQDCWSILRRKYTGPALLFNILALTAFIGAYAARVAMWRGVNQAQSALQHTADRLERTTRQQADTDEPYAAVMTRVADELTNLTPTLTDTAVEYPIWQVLLSVDKLGTHWWLPAFAVLLIVYNIARYLLTRRIGALREEEERSDYAPAWAYYKWPWYVHQYGVRWLFLLAVAAFCVHAWQWVRAPVFLPG